MPNGKGDRNSRFCNNCNGTGKIIIPQYLAGKFLRNITKTCSVCGGTGLKPKKSSIPKNTKKRKGTGFDSSNDDVPY